jgi:hypothetical protein
VNRHMPATPSSAAAGDEDHSRRRIAAFDCLPHPTRIGCLAFLASVWAPSSDLKPAA